MRLRKPGSEPSQGSEKGAARRLGGVGRGAAATAAGIAGELLAIAGEMLRIPAALYMRAAEAAGALTLRAWQLVRPWLLELWRLGRQAVRWAEREVTPARAAIAVAAGLGVLLVASQFIDYRTISISTDQYTGVSAVAPPPEVDGAAVDAGSAHAWLGVPLGLAAIVVAAACATGRPRLAWLLAPIGFLTIAISLIVDAPKGLDEGEAAVAYEGAEAMLLGGFWAQLACGALLLVLAPLLVSLLGPNGHVPAVRGLRWSRLGAAGEAGT